MNWLANATTLFKADKPRHFTNFNHCDECAEHGATLCSSDVNSITLDELGHQGWDPSYFCNDEGKLYYTPAFIRLSLANLENDFYFEQLLFHLEASA